MNAGYVAAWLMLSGAILLATGWKKQLLEDVPAAAAVSFAVLLTAAVAAASRLGPESGIGPLPWPVVPPAFTGACALALIGTLRSGRRRLYAVSCALLAGAVWIWFRKLYDVDPVFVLWDAALDGPLAAGLLAALLTGRIREQFVAAAGASLLAASSAWPAPDGPWAWLDGFAASLAAARVASAAGGAVRRTFGRLRLSSGEGVE